ncbi:MULTISPECIES: IclR family transcriptional regulator [Aeribacillus]|jgi:Transcriptional regulator|uniref:IclR family transcriptional regulator n=1 Tax=Aeribacillus pallidus TaxID=33936 RepID=A0A161ZRJ4_9BACI|nr:MULTISPECIES: IclR family transcriptional regulator [Aeribacillus]KZN95527.1 hypothetical protein AZI98_13890 [Aeribacillus pallidus]MED1442708.1 IclR family transcriptional regulator [Aeribacillus composti]TVZ84653.1 IclR family transcriptional regulator [Aeribacillus composti]
MEMEKKGIKSIEVGFSIVKAVSRSDEPLTITELSKICNMPKSQIYRYLVSLCRIGFLKKGSDLRYALGDELISIGIRAMENVDIHIKAQPFIKQLNKTLDETIALAIWIENEGPIFISWEESSKLIKINVRVGSIVPLTTSATGNIFAAFYPETKTKDLIDRELSKNQMNQKQLEETLSTIKKEGYAYTQSYLPGITAISAPIFGPNKELVAALTVIGLSGVIDISENSIYTKELLKTAKEISRELGY